MTTPCASSTAWTPTAICCRLHWIRTCRLSPTTSAQTVKKMTAVTAILMVDALVSGVYGMNFDIMPELHWQYGYAWALGLMVVASLGLWVLFRRIRWF